MGEQERNSKEKNVYTRQETTKTNKKKEKQQTKTRETIRKTGDERF